VQLGRFNERDALQAVPSSNTAPGPLIDGYGMAYQGENVLALD
jgi:hypothetical protein